MTPIFLLEALEAFVKEHTKDIILQVETEPGADRKERPAEIHKMRLPKKEDQIKRIPYILLQFIKLEDNAEESACMIRIVVATYSENATNGAYDVLNVLMRIRTELERVGILAEQFCLQKPLECMVYPEDHNEYFFGEMITNWTIPEIKREVETIWQ